jgi:hypothetical protein
MNKVFITPSVSEKEIDEQTQNILISLNFPNLLMISKLYIKVILPKKFHFLIVALFLLSWLIFKTITHWPNT